MQKSKIHYTKESVNIEQEYSSTAGKFGKVSKWTPEENGDDHILDK
jgi:hypothetical protein